MQFKHNFLILEKKDMTSKKDGNKYLSLKLFSSGIITDVYVPSDKVGMFTEVKPEETILLTFALKNAYQSTSLVIDPISVEKK